MVYTDVWASMGQEKERGRAQETVLKGYQVNLPLTARGERKKACWSCIASPGPYAGEEITAEVLEGSTIRGLSIRPKTGYTGQKAILEWAVKKIKKIKGKKSRNEKFDIVDNFFKSCGAREPCVFRNNPLPALPLEGEGWEGGAFCAPLR